MPSEIKSEYSRHETLSTGQVVPDPSCCVQCGICSYNCPAGIDVRLHAWKGKSIEDRHCLVCGQCVARCPRGALRFERLSLFDKITHLNDRKNNGT